MTKRILIVIGLFIVGTIGGIFADQILWPYFIERPLFYKYRLEQAPIYVIERKEVTIEENTALQDAVNRVDKTVVNVRSVTVGGKTVEGVGMIVSSDGLVVTLADLFPVNSSTMILWEGRYVKFELLKRDLKENLAIVRIYEKNLPTTSFANFDEIKMGERVFLLSSQAVIIDPSPTMPIADSKKTVKEGIISSLYGGTRLETNITGTAKIKGSPLFDIHGRFLGLALVSDKGEVSAVPVSLVRLSLGM